MVRGKVKSTGTIKSKAWDTNRLMWDYEVQSGDTVSWKNEDELDPA